MFVVFCDCGNTERFKRKISQWPHNYSDDGNNGCSSIGTWYQAKLHTERIYNLRFLRLCGFIV
jgi:hypothetical protein